MTKDPTQSSVFVIRGKTIVRDVFIAGTGKGVDGITVVSQDATIENSQVKVCGGNGFVSLEMPETANSNRAILSETLTTNAERKTATFSDCVSEGNGGDGFHIEGNAALQRCIARHNKGSGFTKTADLEAALNKIEAIIKEQPSLAGSIGDLALERLNKLRSAPDQRSKSLAYESFVSSVSDHITILLPFLPALKELLAI